MPEYDENTKCIGCGLCVVSCSGQSIFLVDEDKEEGYTHITIPYEFLPLPDPGEKGLALGRDGQPVGEAEIVQVKTSPKFDHTHLLTMKVPSEIGMKARFVKVLQEVI